MKLTIEKTYLLNALRDASRVIAKSSSQAILKNIFIETRDDHVSFTGYDLDVSVRVNAPATISENGVITAAADTLNDIASKLPDAPVSLELVGTQLIVKCGRSEFKVPTTDAEDYPVIPIIEAPFIEIDSELFTTALKQVLYAASEEQSRSILCSGLFDIKGNCLRIVTTDTHRLALRELELSAETETNCCIIPASALEAWQGLKFDSRAKVICYRTNGKQAEFFTDSTALTTRILDGQFPAYEKVIPRNHPHCVQIDRSDLLASFRRAMVAEPSMRKVLVDIEDNKLVVSCSSDSGQFREELDVDYQDAAYFGAFDGQYFIDYLSAQPTNEIALHFNTPLNPVLLTSVGQPSQQLDVLMPQQRK